MNTIYLLLGSNLGKSNEQLTKARIQISKKIGTTTRQSGIYQTAAWGNTKQPDFLNQVIIVETLLTAVETMNGILSIEKNMGRKRTQKNEPRIIDIDILFFNKTVIEEPTLIVPHPRISERRFVLIPLNELSPLFIHPVFRKTIHQLLRVCPDKLSVKKI